MVESFKIKDKHINQKDIWADDKLDRKKVADDFTKIIEYIDDPFVVAINSPYGTGKTFFLRRWAEQLRQTDGNVVVEFNAWDTDFQKHPFTPFASSVLSQLETQTKQALPDEFRKKFESVVSIAKNLGNFLLRPFGFGENAIDDVAGIAQETVDWIQDGSQTLKIYQEQTKIIDDFKDELAKIAKNNKIYIFVDELERCRPTYAIELLEIIKHIFNADNVMFILSTDREQLKHTVSNIYGAGMDGKGYLKRFIDLELTLPEPNREAFCNALAMEIIIENEKPDDANSVAVGWQPFREHFILFCNSYKLTLREMAQVYTEAKFVRMMMPDNVLKMTPLLAWILILKLKCPEFYSNIETKTIDELMVKFGETPDDHINRYFKRTLHALVLTRAYITDKQTELKAKFDNETDNSIKDKYGAEFSFWQGIAGLQDSIYMNYNLWNRFNYFQFIKEKIAYLSPVANSQPS